MAPNQEYSNSQYADKYYKRPPSPNPFKEKVRNPREVMIGINGVFQFTHNGISYYTKKGLKYDMIFPEISSYTTLRCLGLKPKVTFLIDKKTGRQGIETKDINHGKEAFLTITDKTNGEKKNTNKIKQINNAIDQNKEHFINDVARAEVIARMLGIDDVTHNNDNVGVGIVNKKPYIYIIDHNPVQYNTDSAYVKKAFFTEYIGFPNILQSCRELLSIENLAWAQKLLNEISILTKYRRGKNDFVEAIKKGRIVALDVLRKNIIIQNKSLHIEFLDSYLDGIINNLTLYKKSIFKSTKNEVLYYNLCYMINDIEKIKKITLQNIPKTTKSNVLCV